MQNLEDVHDALTKLMALGHGELLVRVEKHTVQRIKVSFDTKTSAEVRRITCRPISSDERVQGTA